MRRYSRGADLLMRAIANSGIHNNDDENTSIEQWQMMPNADDTSRNTSYNQVSTTSEVPSSLINQHLDCEITSNDATLNDISDEIMMAFTESRVDMNDMVSISPVQNIASSNSLQPSTSHNNHYYVDDEPIPNYILNETTGEFGINPTIEIPSSSTGEMFLNEITGEMQRRDSDQTYFSPNLSETETEQRVAAFNCSDDDRDATFIPDEEDTSDGNSSGNESILQIVQRKRHGIRNQKLWDRNKNKKLRMQGKAYKGIVKTRDGKWSQTNSRKARKMKEACNCRSIQFECRTLTNEVRKELHDNFWKNLNWEQRKVYIASLVTQVAPTHRRKDNLESSRRNLTLQYHLRMNDNKHRVCKKMFLNTFDLGEKCVRPVFINRS